MGRRDGRPSSASAKPRPSKAVTSGAPPVPEGITAADLDPAVRRELRGLPTGLADEVGARLAAASRLLEEDPEQAYPHAVEAARIASRVAATREALGVLAYATGRWAQARSELRAAARLSGSHDFLPLIADCERGLGHPERALEIAGSQDARRLDRAGQVELRIVASGARRDLGQVDAAVLTLQTADLRDPKAPWAARLRYAYADALLAAGRADEARTWFEKAVAADSDGATEAQERLDELDGTVFSDDGSDVDDEPDDQDAERPGTAAE